MGASQSSHVGINGDHLNLPGIHKPPHFRPGAEKCESLPEFRVKTQIDYVKELDELAAEFGDPVLAKNPAWRIEAKKYRMLCDIIDMELAALERIKARNANGDQDLFMLMEVLIDQREQEVFKMDALLAAGIVENPVQQPQVVVVEKAPRPLRRKKRTVEEDDGRYEDADEEDRPRHHHHNHKHRENDDD
jgi:hypothetical protein